MKSRVTGISKKVSWKYTRWILFGLVWAVCYLIFPRLYGNFGEAAGAIFGVAMMFTGWTFGARRCLLGVFMMIAFLILLKPRDEFILTYLPQFFPGLLVATFTGILAGWVSKLYTESKDQAAELASEKQALVEQIHLREQAELALQELNSELEIRIASRTEELEAANTILTQTMEKHKQVSAHLHESEERLRQLSETLDDMIWLVDIKNYTTLYVSPACEQVYGFPQNQFEENPMFWLNTLHSDDRTWMDAHLESLMQGQTPFDVDYRICDKNGSIKWVWTRVFPIMNEQGEVYRLAGISKDITARKLVEEKLQNSLREKEVLLKEVHHRVKNNLQVISSLLNLASAQITDPQSRQAFVDSQNRVHSMALIHEKLYRSKNLAAINFKDYIEDLTRFLVKSYKKGNANIECKLDVQEVYLSIDTAVPCGLILSELVSNALKHAFPGGQAGKITVHFCQKGESECCLEVFDTGTGLPFDRDHMPTRSLGLVLVNSLVSQLDGTLQVDGQHGARFSIFFPIPEKPVSNLS